MKKECRGVLNHLVRSSRYQGSEFLQHLYDSKSKYHNDECVGAIREHIYNKTQKSLRTRRGVVWVYRGGAVKSIPKGRVVPVTLSKLVARNFAIRKGQSYINEMCVPKEDVLIDINKILGKNYIFSDERELLVLSDRLRVTNIGKISVKSVGYKSNPVNKIQIKWLY